MIFVPLPLLATFALVFILLRLVVTRDMARPAHRLFALLVGAYAGQSLLLSLRWGYGFDGLGVPIALLAPLLPALAVLAYFALDGTARRPWQWAWPLAIVLGIWAMIGVHRDFADLLILISYLGFGGLLVWRGTRSDAPLALVRVGETTQIGRAMIWTGVVLVASALVDIYVITDFIRTGGQNVPFVITITQTGFVLIIGLAAGFGRAAGSESDTNEAAGPAAGADQPRAEDAQVLERIEDAFLTDGLHRDEDLSLRKLARRLGLPDRQVSQAINRVRGLNVSQFVNDYRVRDACKMLVESDDSILNVSLAAGFATKSNFNREFMRVTGKSPSDWRRAARADLGGAP